MVIRHYGNYHGNTSLWRLPWKMRHYGNYHEMRHYGNQSDLKLSNRLHRFLVAVFVMSIRQFWETMPWYQEKRNKWKRKDWLSMSVDEFNPTKPKILQDFGKEHVWDREKTRLFSRKTKTCVWAAEMDNLDSMIFSLRFSVKTKDSILLPTQSQSNSCCQNTLCHTHTEGNKQEIVNNSLTIKGQEKTSHFTRIQESFPTQNELGRKKLQIVQKYTYIYTTMEC